MLRVRRKAFGPWGASSRYLPEGVALSRFSHIADWRVSYFDHFPQMVSAEGIEPSTHGLQVRCSNLLS